MEASQVARFVGNASTMTYCYQAELMSFLVVFQQVDQNNLGIIKRQDLKQCEMTVVRSPHCRRTSLSESLD